MGSFLDDALPVIAAVAATAFGFPEFAPLAAGAAQGGVTASHGGSIGQSLKSAALTGAGSYIGGNIGSALGGGAGSAAGGAAGESAGGAIGTPSLVDAASNLTGSGGGSLLGDSAGSSLGSGAGSSLGNTATNFLGKSVGSGVSSVLGSTAGNALGDYLPAIAGSSIGQAGGSIIGGDIGQSLGAPKPKAPQPWTPSQQPNQALPSSFSGIAGLTPEQSQSNIATQGAFGGLGPQETGYFLNQVNNQLATGNGNSKGMGALSPVEGTFLQKLGLPTGNPSDLLKAISQWQTTNKQAA